SRLPAPARRGVGRARRPARRGPRGGEGPRGSRRLASLRARSRRPAADRDRAGSPRRLGPRRAGEPRRAPRPHRTGTVRGLGSQDAPARAARAPAGFLDIGSIEPQAPSGGCGKLRAAMTETAKDVRHELPGWQLLWIELAADPSSPAAHAALGEAIQRARARHGEALSAEHPTVAAIRRLFRAAGCDPTRYRPSSEALLRRVLKGDELAPIHPLVDLNNALSIELAVPSCIMADGTIEPP